MSPNPPKSSKAELKKMAEGFGILEAQGVLAGDLIFLRAEVLYPWMSMSLSAAESDRAGPLKLVLEEARNSSFGARSKRG